MQSVVDAVIFKTK